MDTTLNEIRSYHPCEDRWRHLLEHLDPRPAGDEPFPVSKVLDVNGLDDTLWLLGQKGEKRLLVRFAADCAERAVERYWKPGRQDGQRLQKALAAVRAWAENPTEKNGKKAAAAAYTAADAALVTTDAEFWVIEAVWTIAAFWASGAVWTIAAAATRAIRYAVRYANGRAAAKEEHEWQTARLRKYLEGE